MMLKSLKLLIALSCLFILGGCSVDRDSINEVKDEQGPRLVSGEIIQKRDHDFSVLIKGEPSWISLGMTPNDNHGNPFSFDDLYVGEVIEVYCNDSVCKEVDHITIIDM